MKFELKINDQLNGLPLEQIKDIENQKTKIVNETQTNAIKKFKNIFITTVVLNTLIVFASCSYDFYNNIYKQKEPHTEINTDIIYPIGFIGAGLSTFQLIRQTNLKIDLDKQELVIRKKIFTDNYLGEKA